MTVRISAESFPMTLIQDCSGPRCVYPLLLLEISLTQIDLISIPSLLEDSLDNVPDVLDEM